MTVKVDAFGLTVQAARPAVIQNVAVAGASALCAPFTTGSIGGYSNDAASSGGTPNRPQTTQHIRLCATTDCWILFGDATAVVTATNGMLLPAMTPEYFWVLPGERLAVMQVSLSGSLNIMECATF